MPVTLSSAGLFPDRRGKGGHTDLMTTSYLLMASPSELLRSRCPFPTTTQRRHFRLPWEQGDETQKEPLLQLHLALLPPSAPGPLSPCFPWTVQTPSRFSCVRLCASPWTVATRLPCPWDSPGKNTGVAGHALLQGIFLPKGWNPCLLSLLHQQAGSLPLAPLGKPPTWTRYLQRVLLLVMLTLQPWAFKGEKAEQSTGEREGEEGRCLGRTVKQSHFRVPDCPPGQPVTTAIPSATSAHSSNVIPRLSCHGDRCPHLPGDTQAHWEVLDHDCFSLRQEGVSPYLWMLSGME